MNACTRSTISRLAPIVLALACAAAAACDREGIPTRRVRISARELPAFVDAGAIVKSSSTLDMWRGIPRDPSQRDRETAVRRASGLFEPTPLAPSAPDVEYLRGYCARGERMSLPEEGVYTLCGGFHADFALLFGGGAHTAEYHLCFGCMEVKIFVDGTETLLLDADDYEFLGRLQPYFRR